MSSLRILAADDDERSLKLLKAIFEGEGYDVLTAHDGQEAFEKLLQTPVDLVISDILMPNVDGYYLCYKIRSDDELKNVPIIIYSGTFIGQGEEKKAEQMGADLFIRKPATRDILLSAVANLLGDKKPPSRAAVVRDSSTEVFHQYNTELIRKLEERNHALEQAKSNLETIVRERTKSLDSANEELLSFNEELRAANEELTSLNDQLELASKEIQKQSEIIIQQKEESLRRSEQNLEIVFSNTRENILVLDREGKAIFFNKVAEDSLFSAFGKRPQTGTHLWDMTAERGEITMTLFARVLKGELIEMEVPYRHNEFMWVRYTPIKIDGEVRFVTIVSYDITEKKAQEAKLKQFEDNMRAIFDNTSDSFTLVDRDFKVLAFNAVSARNCKHFVGHELNVGDDVLKIMSPRRFDSFISLLRRAEQGEVVTVESMNDANGLEKWLKYTIKSAKDSEGKFMGYCLSGHDITSMKKAELEILRLNKSLLDFQNAIYRSAIVSMADKKGIITFVNENFVNISGFMKEELIGKNHRVVNSGHHSKAFWTNVWKTISSGNIWRDRVKNKRKDGDYYWVDTFIMPFVNEQGEIVEYLSIRHDITARKRDEEELLQKRVLLEEAARVAKIGYWVLDIKTNSLSISKEMLLILGTTEEEYAKDHDVIYKRIHPQDRPGVPRMIELTSARHGKMHVEYRIQKDDGTIRWIDQKADFRKILDDEKKVIGVVQDITERKTIEDVLRQYNERFDILSKATNDAIWDLDVRLDVIEWNHAIFNIFGYDEKKVHYTSAWWEAKIHPDDSARVISAYSTAISDRQNTFHETYRFACADGSYKHVFNRCYIIYEDGQPVRIIGAVQDISERVKAVEEIEKLSLVASSTNNGVMITDKNGMIEWVNKSFERISGYSLDEIKGKKSSFLQGTDTDPLTVNRISEKLKRYEIISEEIINYTKTGNRFWLKLDIAPVFDETNNLKNFISVQTDITELKDFESSIMSIARELANLIENANVPIFGVDTSGIINEWNRVTVQLTGYDKMEAMGKKWSEVLRIPSGGVEFDEMFAKAIQGTPQSNLEVPIKAKDDNMLILLVSASARMTLNQKTTGVIFVGQNITELTDYRNNLEQKVEERTQALHKSLEKEKELVKLKNQFVSIASHEFRTPLTSIALASGFIRKYKEKLLPKDMDEKLMNIEKQVNHMTYLLDDILMVGKAEAGKIPVNLRAIEISSFIRNLCDEVAKTTGNSHRINLTENLTYREIACDEKLLRNILINLMTNAIKFSPGTDHVDVSIRTAGEDLFVTVKDYGIGIPENDIQNLFQPFFRAGNVESIQGTGLGLSIIKKAVDLLNGSMTIESKIGEGTMITVQLPV
jgi:PAS domain S-box-containing protein